MNKDVDILSLIESDNLEVFKLNFNTDDWMKNIAKIENYAEVSQYNPNVTYNNCDALKYALHCNADKIFNYLLPFADVDKHGENYGWPLLSMAIKNEKYDYAYSIIAHPKFDPYPIYHRNVFKHIDSYKNPKKHINFLFKLLEKYSKWDFQMENISNIFCELVCYNETTYNRFDKFYQKNINKNGCVLDMFNKNLKVLGNEIFYNNFKPFILNKIKSRNFQELLDSIFEENIIFVPAFEGKNGKKCLEYLVDYPDFLQKYVDKNPVVFSYLPLSSIVFLINNNINLWVEGEKGFCAVDFMLDDSNIKDKTTEYFIKNYTTVIYERLEKLNVKKNIKLSCLNIMNNEQKISKKRKI